MNEEIVELLKNEIAYFKKLKSAIGDIHGHIHGLAVKAAELHLTEKHRTVKSWETSPKYREGIDIVGKNANGKMTVAAEVKTTGRSEKEFLGSQQRSKVKEDIEKLLATNAKHKYLFIIDNKNRKAIESILKDNQGVGINLVNIFEC